MITIVKLLVKPAPDNGDGKEDDDFTDWMDQEALRIPAPPHFPVHYRSEEDLIKAFG